VWIIVDMRSFVHLHPHTMSGQFLDERKSGLFDKITNATGIIKHRSPGFHFFDCMIQCIKSCLRKSITQRISHLSSNDFGNGRVRDSSFIIDSGIDFEHIAVLKDIIIGNSMNHTFIDRQT
jgi:hypothetical protein